MESTPSESSSDSSSTHKHKGESTKGGKRNPLYTKYDELPYLNLSQREKNSIVKSKNCREYRLKKQQQALQALLENATLKGELKQKEDETQYCKQVILQLTSELQQEKAKYAHKEQECREQVVVIQNLAQKVNQLTFSFPKGSGNNQLTDDCTPISLKEREQTLYLVEEPYISNTDALWNDLELLTIPGTLHLNGEGTSGMPTTQ